MKRRPIYPLPVYDPGDEVPRSVNERLAPIFRALADDPDGYEYEWLEWHWPKSEGGESWELSGETLPTTHAECDDFRLVRKRKTITVENLPPPTSVSVFGTHSLVVSFSTQTKADQGIQTIRKAMEGK